MDLPHISHILKVGVSGCQSSFSILHENITNLWFSNVLMGYGKETLASKTNFSQVVTASKVSNYGVFSGPYFPVFGLRKKKLRIWTLLGGG